MATARGRFYWLDLDERLLTHVDLIERWGMSAADAVRVMGRWPLEPDAVSVDESTLYYTLRNVQRLEAERPEIAARDWVALEAASVHQNVTEHQEWDVPLDDHKPRVSLTA